MQKPQDDWPRLARALEQAIRSSAMDDSALSKASGADYFAVRRMRLNGVTNRSKNARKLCSFFNLDGSPSMQAVDTVPADSLQRLAHEAWDGTAVHRQFLEEMLALAGRYKVRAR